MIVQEVDRLNAIGGIGIAGTFAYGGSRNRVMHHPQEKPLLEMTKEQCLNHPGTSVSHFYEKLFKLKDWMNTSAARKIAEERHKFMEDFLEQFHSEWDGVR